ncbi:hypothetical protein C8J57DRAFT_1245721 [Mycena rebaudengoi]|nr:hypothetical protein C8J57DRAFT_1245721 [Mycena rebaudengoi]
MSPTASLPLGRFLCDVLRHPESEAQGYNGCRPTFYFADPLKPPNICFRSDNGCYAFYSLTTPGGFSAIAPDCVDETYDNARMACDLACRQTHTACNGKARNKLWHAGQHEAKEKAMAIAAAATRAAVIEVSHKTKKQVREWSHIHFLHAEANTILLDPKARWFVVGGEHILILDCRDDQAPAPSTLMADTFAEALDLACDGYWLKKGEVWFVVKGVMTQFIPVILSAYAITRQVSGSHNAVIHLCGDQREAENRLRLLQAW